jgi:hypothetical protein
MYTSELLCEGLKACSAGREGSSSESRMFLVKMAVPLYLYPIPLGPIVFYVSTNVSAASVEVVTQVAWRLIHFLLVITVVTPAYLKAWRAPVDSR